MLKYVIVFGLLGFLLGRFVPNPRHGLAGVLGIALLWGLASGPVWGMVTLGELLLGFVIAQVALGGTRKSPPGE